jgi:molybdopterin/thiamine biosynthesis adenylyltransferase
MNAAAFDYDEAFSRNIGLVGDDEQKRLQHACVALPGLGGVGGAHLQALARLGIGKFRLADLDTYDVVNFNRQLGATMASVGRPKVEVARETALSINPNAEVQCFPAGISSENIDAFLTGVDVVVDGIEFFCIGIRRMLFAACHRLRIPIITAGPIGYGAALLVFTPDGVSFDEYFGIDDDMTIAEQLFAFGLGVSPGIIRDVDPSKVDLEKQKGPALSSSCMLCAAVATMEVVKILCARGKLSEAPRGTYYDLYRARTRPLKRRPHLKRSLRGRLIRWLGFRKYPQFLAMHERELRERAAKNVVPEVKRVEP